MEDGGVVPKTLSGSNTGVFIGISSHDYSTLVDSNDNPYLLTGNTNCIAANRLSYLFDFRGPSFVVDTACSSSMVAVHLACQSLWQGECHQAFAGGVQVLISPSVMVSFGKAGLLAPDGRCKTFDAAADGYVRGEGVGVIFLKPYRQAQADGDRIYALIRGTATNQDGRSNGLAAPNPETQTAVAREAYRQAGVSPGQVQYLEAHGTGTKIGDPIELKAIAKVLIEERASDQPCRVGSVKTNVGHSETAAGITSLIKVALSLKHKLIPPSLNFEQPNPYIDFEQLLLQVQQELTPWPNPHVPALAGVSSFGFGGSNAHVVLEEAPAPPSSQTSLAETIPLPIHLLPLSAKTEDALQALCQQYTLLTQQPELSLTDLCYAAATQRSHFKHRLAITVASIDELQEQLTALQGGEKTAANSQRKGHRDFS